MAGVAEAAGDAATGLAGAAEDQGRHVIKQPQNGETIHGWKSS
jgi:hypothetical protein